MAARTRFGVDGYGVRRAGSFFGKTLAQPVLDLTVNPKWLRYAVERSFSVSALARIFRGSKSRSFERQAKPS